MPDGNDEHAWPELGDMPAEEFRDRPASRCRLGGRLPREHRRAKNLARHRARRDQPHACRKSPPDEPGRFQGYLSRLSENRFMPGIVHWGHPAFLGYFGSTTTAAGILGEMLAAALNVSAMTWRTSPAATELGDVGARLAAPDAWAARGLYRCRLRHRFSRRAACAGGGA